MIGRYLLNLLISIDQLGNTIIGGDPDETLSSRAGKAYHNGVKWPKKFVNSLFFWQKDHCEDSIEHDEGGEQITKH